MTARFGVADTPAPENIEGERKTVTALFADITGSTELMEISTPKRRARLSIRRSSS
jgi:class 3 adenylate cyclase